MKKLVRGLSRPMTFVPLLMFTLIGFAISYQFLVGDMLAIIINGVLIGVWVAVMAAYFPVLIRVLRDDEIKQDQNLVMGILVLLTALAMSRIWAIVVLMLDRPIWSVGHWIPTLCYTIAALSGFYFLVVPAASADEIKGKAYFTSAAILAIMIIVGMLAYLS